MHTHTTPPYFVSLLGGKQLYILLFLVSVRILVCSLSLNFQLKSSSNFLFVNLPFKPSHPSPLPHLATNPSVRQSIMTKYTTNYPQIQKNPAPGDMTPSTYLSIHSVHLCMYPSALMYRVSINYCIFFPKKLNILRPLPLQHWTAIGCSENGQSIRVSVHSDLR